MILGRTAAVALLVAPLLLTPAPARAADCATAGQVTGTAAWPRQMLAVDSVSQFTRGGNVVVAVLSTGVQASHRQLAGRVLAGRDADAGRGTADTDCLGTGTQVAGVIAASPEEGSPVAGVAGRATILPVRVAPSTPGDEPSAAGLARGVEFAVQNGAQVIVVASAVYQDSDRLRSAVAAAVATGVPVVAAVGDLGSAQDRNPVPYPASYPDVIGVGAIDQSGRIYDRSQHGRYVDLVAPGVAVPTLQGGDAGPRGLVESDGTALAAGYVGGTVALIRSRLGRMPVAEVTRVLKASASPAVDGDAFGAGVVNPYAAVTGKAATGKGRALPGLTAPPAAPGSAESRRRMVAFTGATIAGMAVVAVLLVTAAIRRSRRQHWRPTTAPPLPEYDEPVEPGPPVMLLDPPPGGAR